MPMAQSDLAREFVRGATSGRASNVEIRETEERTFLVGYGHAVYAEREKATGEVTYYAGWHFQQSRPRAHSGSPSTKSQLGTMSLFSKADRIVAYHSTNTDSEQSLRNNATEVTDNARRCAPKVSEV